MVDGDGASVNMGIQADVVAHLLSRSELRAAKIIKGRLLHNLSDKLQAVSQNMSVLLCCKKILVYAHGPVRIIGRQR
jgi:hypothetical protein